MAEHTWDRARALEKVWADGDHTAGWIPFGYQRLICGCLVDTFMGHEMRRPCMAHEGDGHVSAISEQDGMHVARCLVLVCPWQGSWAWESDAVSAAQGHWRSTRTQTAVESAGKN